MILLFDHTRNSLNCNVALRSPATLLLSFNKFENVRKRETKKCVIIRNAFDNYVILNGQFFNLCIYSVFISSRN